MRPSAAKIVFAVAITIGLFPLLYAGAQEAKKDKTDKKVEAQKKAAEDYWKQLYEGEKLPLAETAHFLVVGGKPGKELASAGAELQQQYVKARKVLELEKDRQAWEGKLTVFLVHDADKYPRMIRLLERRKTEEGETGAFDNDPDFPYVVARDGSAPGDLGAQGNAGIHMVTLLLTIRLKTPLPEWLSEGFGRATVLQVGPAATLAADRKKASLILKKANRTLDSIFNNTLEPEEQAYLRTSFADYLAYSGRTAKFLPFLDGFRLDANGNAGTVDTALKNANLTKDQLQNNWLKYAKSFK